MKRLLLFLLVILSATASVRAAENAKTTSVTFYHTSDQHEHSAPMAQIAGFVEAQKKQQPNVLLVDTGDWFNKGDLTDLNTRGEAMAAMLGACKYDAVIPGNHDYSFGTKRLAKLIDTHSLPLVAANCRWPEDIKPQQAVPSRIFKLEGVTVGIIGTATTIFGQRTDKLLEILPIDESLRDVVTKLDEQVDVIVLLTHVGLEADRKLAVALPRVDVIFGGHNHKRFAKLDFNAETQTVIQHSGCFGQHIGELTLTLDGGKIVDRKVRLLNVTAEMPLSAAVEAVHAKYVPKPPVEEQPSPAVQEPVENR
ncbi:MAG: metallophosphoesterase [Candidatus Nealsonbacteria bacterium]|nr:metallophosphoesterase [Candidatus Nealsonbacteria bacterium]